MGSCIPSAGGDSTFLGTAGFSSMTGFFGTSGTLKILVLLRGWEVYGIYITPITSCSNNPESYPRPKFIVR